MMITKSLLPALLLALGAGGALAQQKIVPAQSEVAFTSKQMGVPVDGKFKKWDAQIAFDPKKPEAGKVSFTIDGNVHDVVVPVALTQAGPLTTASGAFTIKRLEYKIGEGEWTDTSMVANDVLVKFKLAVTGVAPL